MVTRSSCRAPSSTSPFNPPRTDSTSKCRRTRRAMPRGSWIAPPRGLRPRWCPPFRCADRAESASAADRWGPHRALRSLLVPEIPDLEVYLQHLRRRVAGHPLLRARIASVFLVRTFDPPIRALEGKRVIGLRRIGK